MEDNAIIGSQNAFMSQLCWQIKHEWSKDKSLEKWHENHPDISDDVFDKLYDEALICRAASIKFSEPFCNLTIGECFRWVRQSSKSRSEKS